MYCRNYTGTISHVLCREVCYSVSLFGRDHYWRIHCINHYHNFPKEFSNCGKSRRIYCRSTQYEPGPKPSS